MIRLATIALFAVLAHTVLMAGASGAVEPAHAHATRSSASGEPSLGSPGRDSHCLIGQASATAPPAPLPAYDTALPRQPLDVERGSTPSNALGPTPRHPPNVIRALLQVYRI